MRDSFNVDQPDTATRGIDVVAQASWGAGFVPATTTTATTRTSEAMRDDIAVVGVRGGRGRVFKDVVVFRGVVDGLLEGGEFHLLWRLSV